MNEELEQLREAMREIRVEITAVSEDVRAVFHERPALYKAIVRIDAISIEATTEIERLRTPETDTRRAAVNILLEKIAEKFTSWETMDIWRSDAADMVRSFKHNLEPKS